MVVQEERALQLQVPAEPVEGEVVVQDQPEMVEVQPEQQQELQVQEGEEQEQPEQ
jgi:hypothetical protein